MVLIILSISYPFSRLIKLSNFHSLRRLCHKGLCLYQALQERTVIAEKAAEEVCFGPNMKSNVLCSKLGIICSDIKLKRMINEDFQ